MAFLDVPANIVAMRGEITSRFSSVLLKQLTNPGHINPTTATIQTDPIDRAIKDAVGEFEQRTGHEVTLEDESHTAAIAQGVVAFLYSWKGAQHQLQEQYFLRFVSMATAVRNTSQVASSSTNDLDDDPEKSANGGIVTGKQI